MHLTPQIIRERLNQAISFVSEHSDDYVFHPGRDFSRTRKLTMERVLRFMLTMEGKSLPGELMSYSNYDVMAPTPQAFVQARDKITVEGFSALFEKFMSFGLDIKLYKGYQLLAHDGSDISVPTDPKHPTTINGNQHSDFSLLHLNAFFDVLSKQYIDIDYQHKRKSDERQSLCEMIDTMTFKNPSIIIADRGYESYNVYEHIRLAGQKFVIRAKDIESNGFLNNTTLPGTATFDTKVSIKLTRRQTKQVRSNPEYHFLSTTSKFDYLPEGSKESYPITLRVVRIEISPGNYECLVTNLESDEFSIEDLKELYHLRWGIETSFRELKYPLGLINLHAKKLDAIYKEIYARLIMYNFSMMITMSIKPKEGNRKDDYQVNFTQAIGICRAYFKDVSIKVIELIQKHILPIRPDRPDQRDKAKQKKRRPRRTASLLYRMA
jgi:hypothetical protein